MAKLNEDTKWKVRMAGRWGWRYLALAALPTRNAQQLRARAVTTSFGRVVAFLEPEGEHRLQADAQFAPPDLGFLFPVNGNRDDFSLAGIGVQVVAATYAPERPALAASSSRHLCCRPEWTFRSHARPGVGGIDGCRGCGRSETCTVQ